MYKYNLTSTNESSHKYGNCDICGNYVTEVFRQTEEREYLNPVTKQMSLTKNNCYDYFGHEECLKNKQRN